MSWTYRKLPEMAGTLRKLFKKFTSWTYGNPRAFQNAYFLKNTTLLESTSWSGTHRNSLQIYKLPKTLRKLLKYSQACQDPKNID